jgi:hypothetical protein
MRWHLPQVADGMCRTVLDEIAAVSGSSLAAQLSLLSILNQHKTLCFPALRAALLKFLL